MLGAKQVRKYHISQVSSGNLRPGYEERSPAEQAGFEDAARSAGFRYEVTKVTVPKRVGRDERMSVVTRWANAGSAPTYDAWKVVLRVRDGDGTTVATRNLRIDLRLLLPGRQTYRSALRLPKLAAGRYDLAVAVLDPSGYLAPMNLAIKGRARDGSYRVGSVRVTR